jgi:hypothetical protein
MCVDAGPAGLSPHIRHGCVVCVEPGAKDDVHVTYGQLPLVIPASSSRCAAFDLEGAYMFVNSLISRLYSFVVLASTHVIVPCGVAMAPVWDYSQYYLS